MSYFVQQLINKYKANGGKIFAFDVDQSSERLNPIDFATDDESRNYVIAMFATIAQVTLTTEEHETALAILKSLPAGSAIADFIRAANEQAAASLGISVESLHALAPLITALRSHQDGRLHAMFDQAPAPGTVQA